MSLRIVADENMPNVDAWFSSVADSIVRKPGRNLSSADLMEADVLLVRSVTKVNESLLAGTPVKFVGSATIGTDHIDQRFLANNTISFHYAPGCNAQSVADWLLAVLSRLHIDHDLDWWNKTIGIVGVGNVGGTVRQALEAFGCRLILCDPPKHDEDLLAEHSELPEVLSQCDVICFHTPHTIDGNYPTDGMISDEQLQLVRDDAWIINAGRGPVFQREAILKHAQQRNLKFVLDVFPHEPQVDQDLLLLCSLASPHVAGYSLEGKFKGTEMLATEVFKWAGVKSVTAPELPRAFTVDARLYEQDDLNQWASEIALAVYDPARDTATMVATLENGRIKSDMFDRLRKEYPTRREIGAVSVRNVPDSLRPWLSKFGFQCE